MRRRWVLAAVVAFPAALVGWIAWTVFTALTADPMTQVEAASCEDAMRYADQDGLPKGAQDAKCTVRAWLDTEYRARFTITRTDLDAWLKEAYPGTRLTSEYCSGTPVDVCAHIDLHPEAEGGAMAVDLTVQYGEDSTAVVDFSAYDV
ncbi:hypothetical protein FNV64_07460 [Streptomyces sp. S1A1-7]|uniref:hypothetical protein n=1 Tax=Streptomyces sp. S1A1-7 TaxID=2594459 RepID=UPI00116309BF|nr:hypothetical protein [Streptomyces sp. S1A1-7]QDN75465.1 hypothetical protein FNV64_07460 [Streptomyces sp. S1A1-7]